MNCHDAREMLSALVDEALTSDERTRVHAHLAECADCRKELERLSATVTLLQRMERPRAPVGFVDRVVAAAQPMPWHRRWFGRLFLPFSVKLPAEAAALLLVAGLAVFVFERTPELQQATRQQPASRGALDQLAPVMSKPSQPIPARPAPIAAPPAPSGAQSPAPRTALPAQAPVTPSTAPSSNVLLSSPGRVRDARNEGRADEAKEKMARTEEARVARDERASESGAKMATASPEPSPPPAMPSTDEMKAQALKKEADVVQKSAAAGAAVARKSAPAAAPAAPAPPPPPVAAPMAPAPAAPLPAPALERQAVSPGEMSPPRPDAPAPQRKRVLPSADVIGRLAVKDLGAAQQALVDLVARSGGVITSRRNDGGTVLMEVAIPRPVYGEFNAGLTRIGSWQPEGEPAESATSVRITLRLVP